MASVAGKKRKRGRILKKILVWVLVLVPMHHTVIMVEASYPVTWLTASVLFAAYYLKGNWLSRCIAARQAAEQEE